MSNRIGTFTKTVTTAGTRVALSSTDLKVSAVLVQALSTNTGFIHVGDVTVLASTLLGVRLGIPSSGSTPASVTFSSAHFGGNDVNLADFYIDSTVNGEGVSVTWTKA